MRIFRIFGLDFSNWLSNKFQLGIYGVNTMCAFIFLLGLFKFLEIFENDRDFYLGLLISYPYLIMVVENGYTRQSVALGLVLWSYRLLLKEESAKAFLLLALAFLFHKTSAIGFIAFLFQKSSRKLLFFVVGASLLFYAYLEQLFERYYELYVESPMISEGGFLMLVWLLFAVHAPAGIPYKNLLIL